MRRLLDVRAYLIVVASTVAVVVGCDNLSVEFGDQGRPLVQSAEIVQEPTVAAPADTPARRTFVVVETRTPASANPFGRPYHRAPVVSPTVVSGAGLAVASSGALCQLEVIERPVEDIERMLAGTPGELNYEQIGKVASGESLRTVSPGQAGFETYAEFTLLILRDSELPDEQRRQIEGFIHDCIRQTR